MGRSLLPDTISGVPEFAAFEQLAREVFDELPTGDIMTHLYDTCPSEVLDALLWENGLDGYAGSYFCTSDADKRRILKKATYLKDKRGKDVGILTALEVIAGIPGCAINDNLGGITYNGQYIFNGGQTFNGHHWSDFEVLIPAAVFNTLSSGQLADLEKLINKYKRTVCRLIGIYSFAGIGSLTSSLSIIHI